MEIVCIDYLSLELSNEIVENILVITDHLTGYAQAIPTRYQAARTAARVLFDNFIVHNGFPACIHSDRDQYFESNLSRNCVLLPMLKGNAQHPITPWGMERLKSSTKHFCR